MGLQLAVLLDSPAIVARLLKTAAGGLNFGPALDMMWSASEHKPPKVVPDPKVCSVAKLALQCRAKAVLEWCLGTGPEEVMLQFLTEGGEGAHVWV